MAFKTGLGTFKDLVSGGQDRPSTPRGLITPRLRFLNWKDGEQHIVRFLTDIDEMIKGEFAEYVLTNTFRDDGVQRTDDFLIDPDSTNWVRHFGAKAKLFTGEVVEPKPRKLGVAIVVERKEHHLGGGRVEFVDKEEEIEVDGKKYPSRLFWLVRQSPRNFWQHFEGMANRNKTITDRDFEIVRRGDDKTTRYQVSPLDPVEGLRDHAKLHEVYGYGRPYNPEDPDRYLYCPETLQQWAARYSGEERATALLGPRDEANQVITQDAHPDDGLDEFRPVILDDEAQAGDKFAQMRDKIQAHLK